MFETDYFRLKKRNVFALVIVALLVVLLLPTVARFYAGNSSFVGPEPYYHYRVANALSRTGSLNMFTPPDSVADLTYLERNEAVTPFHYLLVYASGLFSLAGAIRIVPLVLGILSILIFNLILKRLINRDYQRHIVLLLLVINPAFIYTFTAANPHCAAIFFTLLGLYFFMKERQVYFWLSVLCFVIVSFFSLFNTLLALLLLFAYILYWRKRYNRLVITFLVLAVVSLTHRLSFYYNYTYTSKIHILGNLFSDLGGMIGFGVFTIILAFYGVFVNWKHKSSFLQFFILGICIFLSLFLVGNIANMYLAFFVAFAAGAGVVRLYESDWAVKDLRALTLFILLCGLVFSCASYLNRLTTMGPYDEDVEALMWLGSNTFKDGFVLSAYDNGYLITTISRNPVLADAYASSSYDQSFLYKIQDTMFYSRKLPEVKKLFEAYNINYVYVDNEMKDGGIWNREDEGLLFLFTNRETFEKVYDENGIEIWEVLDTSVDEKVI